MDNEKQLIRWEKHYSDGSVEYTDETSTKNFSDNLSCADGLIVSRSYIKMKPVNWHTLEQKLNKHNVMASLPFEHCGKGENICSCTKASECGYLSGNEP